MQTNSTANRERAQLRRSGDNKIIASVTDDLLHKFVDASRHFLKKPPAIAFDLDVLAQAKEPCVRFVEVIDRESGTTYRTSLERIWSKGFHVDRGHGAQIALALSEWNQGGEPIADQATLWDSQ